MDIMSVLSVRNADFQTTEGSRIISNEMGNNIPPNKTRVQDTVEISREARLKAGAEQNPVSNLQEGEASAGVVTNLTSLREGYPLEKQSALESQESTSVVPPQVTGEISGSEPVSPQEASILSLGSLEVAAPVESMAVEAARTTEIIKNTYGVPGTPPASSANQTEMNTTPNPESTLPATTINNSVNTESNTGTLNFLNPTNPTGLENPMVASNISNTPNDVNTNEITTPIAQSLKTENNSNNLNNSTAPYRENLLLQNVSSQLAQTVPVQAAISILG